MKALPLTPPSHKVCFMPRKGQLDALLRSNPPKREWKQFQNFRLKLCIVQFKLGRVSAVRTPS